MAISAAPGIVPSAAQGPVVPRRQRDTAITSWCAGLCVLLVGARVDLGHGLTLGVLVSAAFLPVWFPRARRWVGYGWLASLICLALLSGVWLAEAASATFRVSQQVAFVIYMLVLQLGIGVGVVLWARGAMGSARTALLFGTGMLVADKGAALRSGEWRFGLEVPVTVIVLAAAWLARRWWVQVVAAAGLVAVSAPNGGRSATAILALSLVVTVGQALPRATGRRASRTKVAAIAIALVLALYNVGQTLIVDGFLGEAAQQRTAFQINQSGSVLLGARPEMGATAALFLDRPMGFGTGTVPDAHTVAVAKVGMTHLGYDPDNGYVEHYMLGNGFVLHSTLGEFWAWFGIVGIALVATALVLVAGGYLRYLANRRAAALLTCLTTYALWNLFFSPSYSSLPLMILALGLLVWPKASPDDARGRDVGGPGWVEAGDDQGR